MWFNSLHTGLHPREKTLLPLFGQHGDDKRGLEIPGDATARSLSQIMAEEFMMVDFKLWAGGRTFDLDDDQTLLPDLGISAEEHIHITPIIPQWEYMYKTFGPILENRDESKWYQGAVACMESRNPLNYTDYHSICSDKVICGTYATNLHGLIACNAQNEITAINMAKTRFKLQGHLSLDMIPSTVESIYLGYQRISSVDFKGLSNGKSLRVLSLEHNQITDIDLKQLKGTSLNDLGLDNNQISGTLALSDLSETKLTDLYLPNNQIAHLTFEGMSPCSLTRLDLSGNPIRTMNFIGIRHLNLNSFEPGDQLHLLDRVRGFMELKDAQIRNDRFYHYLLNHHSSVCGIREFVVADQQQGGLESPNYSNRSPLPSGEQQNVEEAPLDMTLSWILISIAVLMVLGSIAVNIYICYITPKSPYAKNKVTEVSAKEERRESHDHCSLVIK